MTLSAVNPECRQVFLAAGEVQLRFAGKCKEQRYG